MTNLFTARTDAVFRHAQASYACGGETPPLSRIFTSAPDLLSADLSRSHTPSAHARFTKTLRFFAAYAWTRIEYPWAWKASFKSLFQKRTG
jgi:hypothetical protein